MNKVLKIRLDDDLDHQIKVAAEVDGRTLSDWIRRALWRATEDAALPTPRPKPSRKPGRRKQRK